MSGEYLKVLSHLNCEVTVVSRSIAKINSLKKSFSGLQILSKGIVG